MTFYKKPEKPIRPVDAEDATRPAEGTETELASGGAVEQDVPIVAGEAGPETSEPQP